TAPELVDGQPADARSDLFSLGATLYRCATGQPAFAGPTLTAIMRAVTAHDPPPPHQLNRAVPGPLSDLIMRLLAKDPSARPQSAQHLLRDLVARGEHRPSPVGRPAASSPPPRPRGRGLGGRRRWAVLIAAAVLLAAIGGWLVTHPPGQGVVPERAPIDPPTRVRY